MEELALLVKRFGLCVLHYMVTSNRVHLVKETGEDVITQSMQLIAGRTAQEYNQCKNGQGAFWEDGIMLLRWRPTSTYIAVWYTLT